MGQPFAGGQAARARQVVAAQQRIVAGIRLQRAGARSGIGDQRVGVGAAIGVEADRIERRVHDPERVVLGENRVLPRDPALDVVDAFHVGEIGVRPQVGQPAVLPDAGGLQVGDEIGERVVARIIVVLVLPREPARP